MTTVKAQHTIHRVGKTQGQQDVVAPNTVFECSGKELDDLVALGAVEVVAEDKPAAKKTASRKSSKSSKSAPADETDDADALEL